MPPQTPLRGAIVGFGFISGKGHLPAYLERAKAKGDVRIDAIADVSPARLEEARKALPEARIYSDASELIEKEAGNLDFIDLSTPPYEHARLSIEALQKGLHVLCEKPLATSIDEAKSMLAAAKASKRVLFPCHNYKHAPVVRAIREVIDSGVIGEVRSVYLQTFRNTHAKGVPEWKTHWRRDMRYSGGGIAMDHGSHTFYLTFDWLNSYPTAVTAKMANQSASLPDLPGGLRFDNEDQFSCVLTFPDGKLACANLTWTAGVRKVIYSVQGSKGALTVEDDDLEIARMIATDGPDVAQGAVKWETEKRSIASNWMDASHVTWFDSLFTQFTHSIATKEWVGKETEEAYRCVELIQTAYASAKDSSRELPLRGLP